MIFSRRHTLKARPAAYTSAKDMSLTAFEFNRHNDIPLKQRTVVAVKAYGVYRPVLRNPDFDVGGASGFIIIGGQAAIIILIVQLPRKSPGCYSPRTIERLINVHLSLPVLAKRGRSGDGRMDWSEYRTERENERDRKQHNGFYKHFFIHFFRILS